MRSLVVIALFSDPGKADSVQKELLKTELENPISPEEAVVPVMTSNREVRINDTTPPRAAGVAWWRVCGHPGRADTFQSFTGRDRRYCRYRDRGDPRCPERGRYR